MISDIEIAQSCELKPISEIAEKLKVPTDELELYGKYKAKLPLSLIQDDTIEKSHLILVTAITPTPAGEGKTTVSIGLAEGLSEIGKQAVVVLREPSLGPVFGIKGGAAGGGNAQVVPMEDINLHFTGDFNAVEKANNLLAALIDNEIHFNGNNLNIDPRTVTWKRVMDINDRALRQVITGLGGKINGVPRETGFDITPASEVMAILCMAKDFEDLKTRLGNILVGFTHDRLPVFARDLKAEDAMAILLKDAMKPNLVQTLNGTPAIIHGGPFANIAQGTNTLVATKMGLSLSNFVVTEAGFGADLGAEKFLNIKSVAGGLKPEIVVVVGTIRALKHHGGVGKEQYDIPDVDAVTKGFSNLQKHLENIQKFNLIPIVAINKFESDSDEEIAQVIALCNELRVQAVVSNSHRLGGKGNMELAQMVVDSLDEPTNFRPLYASTQSIEDKIDVVAKEIYGASRIEYDKSALNKLNTIKNLNMEHLAVCIAKTQMSFSQDPKKIGRPTDFTIVIRDIEIASGAGFVIPIVGDMMRMPGLPKHPASENMQIDAFGKIKGLS
ncbi:formate--tetrahydrofolate ligase [Mangrovimonas sp. AS39]|uniref:formate--tetrahydrofolate ligase n=1 Tax=Mangrovimonas futianensis TaxID=2895523 RepID=UPI001E384A70|nr:formate--tetrahydrofolate ligase [Mangrovimonas futianensis]MCF1190873.1 formate--tetrahydrofolate ligase [Mangrovimonas futianensis]MCF1194569.1 formate--tetrahydrofolate ligase [Mangrovimonas futianensis]